MTNILTGIKNDRIIEPYIYVDRPQHLQELKNRINVEISSIMSEFIHNVLAEYVRRFAYYQETGEWHFEHII